MLSTFRTKSSRASKKELNDMDNIYAERVSKSIILLIIVHPKDLSSLYAQFIDLLALMACSIFDVFPTSLIISFTIR